MVLFYGEGSTIILKHRIKNIPMCFSCLFCCTTACSSAPIEDWFKVSNSSHCFGWLFSGESLCCWCVVFFLVCVHLWRAVSVNCKTKPFKDNCHPAFNFLDFWIWLLKELWCYNAALFAKALSAVCLHCCLLTLSLFYSGPKACGVM